MGRMPKTIDGLPVIDATKPLKVTVTTPDITKADVKEPGNCAFARACKRDLHIQEARVHLGRVYIKPFGAKSWTRYLTPKNLRSEIVAFDRGGRFLEGSFILKKPTPSYILGADKKRKRKAGPKIKKMRGYTQIRDVRGGPA